jgi:hypothetical protein
MTDELAALARRIVDLVESHAPEPFIPGANDPVREMVIRRIADMIRTEGGHMAQTPTPKPPTPTTPTPPPSTPTPTGPTDPTPPDVRHGQG